MNIAKKILALCDQYGITPNKLASLSGVPSTTLQDIVNGKNKSPQIKTIERICDGLDIELSEFFATEEKQKPSLPPEAQRMLKAFEAFLYSEYGRSK